MSLEMSLGERLRLSRMRKRLTQKQAAEKLNISNNVLSSYERDARDPDTKILRGLSELYDVSTDFLLGLTNNPDKEDSRNTSKLLQVFDQAVFEIKSDYEKNIYINEDELDDETLLLIKRALKNGMKFVDDMKHNRD
ncbi:helix-turn-helix transcriptional regulator [Alkalicoccobacillus gibsonii]|uniref:Helix-turn-helix transcriptional regulator n=1 Tax=Alkalicoccobacillus gibsonii TaxID=79881 RepID=A0ABU9VF75_9BACI